MPPENPKPSEEKTTGTSDSGTKKPACTGAVGTKKVKRHCIKDATSSKPKGKQQQLQQKKKKKKKKTKENNVPQTSEDDEQSKRQQTHFTVSPTLSVTDWETGKKRPSYLKALPKVDLQRAIFLPFPTKKIWADVSPYPHEELEAARGRLIAGLNCNSPVFSRVKLKCGILPDGRRFAIPPPDFNPQDGFPDPSASSVTCALFARKRARVATHTVTSQQAEEPALEAPDSDVIFVGAQDYTGDREHPPKEQYAGPSVASSVLSTQTSVSLKRPLAGSSSASDLDGGVQRKRGRVEPCGGESSSLELSSSRTHALTNSGSEHLRASGSGSGFGQKVLPDSASGMLPSASHSQGASDGSLNFASFRSSHKPFQHRWRGTAIPKFAGTIANGISSNLGTSMCPISVSDSPPSRRGPKSGVPDAPVGKAGPGPGAKASGKAAPAQGGKKPLSRKKLKSKRYWHSRRRSLEKKADGNPVKVEGGKAAKKKKKKKIKD